jgi:uncharacterized protein (TIGR02001 family)
MRAIPVLVLCLALLVTCRVAMADAAEARAKANEHWDGPFGGTFSATFAVVSDYSFGGISQTALQPAVQPGFGYTTPQLGETVALSAYVWTWGSNINFASSGPGLEVDLMGGLKLKAYDKRLNVDVGYLRYTYPGSAPQLNYDYGDFALQVGYDFGLVQINGKVRYSPNSFGNSGTAWNKRLQIAAPLPFLWVNENITFKAFGTLGNQWVDRYLNYGIPSNQYWYWQIGFVTTLYGIDFTAAYTDTNIDIAGCGNNGDCQGRVILSVSKTF